MNPRALLPLFLSFAIGCTSTETIPTSARFALAQTTSNDFVRLPTASGGVVEIGPSASLEIDGETVNAGDLYWSEWGLYRKTGETISRWDDIRSIRVEQLDGAATVAVTATVAILIVAIAALLKSAPSGSGGKGGGSGGSGGAKAPSARSAPNPSPIIPDPRFTDVAFRTLEAVSSTSRGPGVTVPTEEEESTTATPLFSRGARRRANIRALARLEGGACWPGSKSDCLVSGGRIGVRLIDIFELTGGVRVESNQLDAKPYAVFGAMLHGESPAAHWFALALGASVAYDGIRAHVVPELAVRFRPFRSAGVWLGLVPVAPVYATDTDTWSMASGVELTGEL